MTRERLFERQLRRVGVSRDKPPTLDQWQTYLEHVDRTYAADEQDRYTLERSLSISSNEMRTLYDDLKRSSESLLSIEHDKLRKSVAVHEAILESAFDGVLVVDEQRRTVAFSKRFTELWRLATDEIEEFASDAIEPLARRVPDPVSFAARIDEIYARPCDPSQDELQLLDGRTIDRVSAPVRSSESESETHGRVWFFRDITARMEQERRVRDANGFLDSIVENIPNMVFVKDATTLQFVRLNRAGEELLGTTREMLLGTTDHDHFPADQADAFQTADREVLAGRNLVTMEEQIATKHGTRWLSTKKIPIVDEHGTPRYLLGISEDITEPLRKRAELFAAKEAAERANRAKSDFLLNMSHEMRTPLNAILGFSRVLEREDRMAQNSEHHEYLENIVQASEHMLALINDLLDLRSLEEAQPALAPLALGPVIRETMELVSSLLDERALDVTVDVSHELPLVLADRRAVVQILMNLVSNAAKFTPPHGSVVLTAQAAASRVHVSVRDTGIGIAPEDQSRLFTYFEQVGGKHAHHMKGSGVGLALTRALVERQGGTISLHSTVGVGTTFVFDLAAAP